MHVLLYVVIAALVALLCVAFALRRYIDVQTIRRYVRRSVMVVAFFAFAVCLIITSNIPSTDVYLKTTYYDLLNSVESVRDNAGLMAMRFLINLGVKKIYLAGFDGYSYDVQQNYADESMTFFTRKAVIDEMNAGMSEVLSRLKTQIDIEFLTKKGFVYLR